MNAVDLAKEGSLKQQDIHDEQYRSISKAAVVSVVFAILGLVSMLAPMFCIIPFLGLCFGLLGLANLKRYPNELIGRRAATIGTIVNLVLLVGSISVHSYIYATEVPDGYQRISFYQLRPNDRTPLPFAESAEEFNGKKVFLKGNVRPSARKNNLKEFILVGDFSSCCFGGNPKITDIVSINIETDQTVDYSLRLRRITGEFRLNPRKKQITEKDIPSVFYEIIADGVR